jgi:ribosome-binding ATPase
MLMKNHIKTWLILKCRFHNQNVIPICAKLENELSQLGKDDQKEFLADYGLKSSGLERLIQKAYDTLGLQSFYTAGIKEAKAWTIHQGDTAPKAAGA